MYKTTSVSNYCLNFVKCKYTDHISAGASLPVKATKYWPELPISNSAHGDSKRSTWVAVHCLPWILEHQSTSSGSPNWTKCGPGPFHTALPKPNNKGCFLQQQLLLVFGGTHTRGCTAVLPSIELILPQTSKIFSTGKKFSPLSVSSLPNCPQVQQSLLIQVPRAVQLSPDSISRPLFVHLLHWDEY